MDYVFHEAAIPGVPQSIWDPAATNETNVTGTLNVLIAAKDNLVKKVIFASSCAVYGDGPTSMKDESLLPSPQSPYAVSKLAAEHYCAVFSQVYNLPTAGLRYFNVYGPRQNADSDYAAVIPKFLQKFINRKRPQIYGDGEQSRDFIYVKDIVAANLLIAESSTTGIFNIGSGEKITLNKLVQIMQLLLDREDIKPVHVAERPGDIKHSLADITKARNTGYTPKYTLPAGLRDMLDIKLIQLAPLDQGNPRTYSYENRGLRR